MSLQLAFVALALALVGVAAVLFLLAVIRRQRQFANLSLAIVFAALAVGVWWTAIRAPLTLR